MKTLELNNEEVEVIEAAMKAYIEILGKNADSAVRPEDKLHLYGYLEYARKLGTKIITA